MIESYSYAEFAASSYMEPYLKPHSMRTRLRLASRALREHNFDTIAFRGMSGAVLGPALAVRLDKEMILVRKPGDGSHSCLKTEGYKRALRYIIVDDFIDTGNTMNIITQAIADFAPDAKCLGLLQVSNIEACEFKATDPRKRPYKLGQLPERFRRPKCKHHD